MRRVTLTERRAIWIYEAARLEAIASCRPIVPEVWDDRELPFQEQFICTIERICTPDYETTPEVEHDSWYNAYLDMGWVYGPVRDVSLKTHPDMVPFDQLPKAEREKDEVFIALCAFARDYIKEASPCAE